MKKKLTLANRALFAFDSLALTSISCVINESIPTPACFFNKNSNWEFYKKIINSSKKIFYRS